VVDERVTYIADGALAVDVPVISFVCPQCNLAVHAL
jgi:hypothetical protein